MSREAFADTLCSDDRMLNASPLKVVAASAASTSGALGPNGFTVPLLSSGRIAE